MSVKNEHIPEISEILSNIPRQCLNWEILALQIIEQKDWTNIENEKVYIFQIFKTLQCWISNKGQGAKFCDLLRIVGYQSKDAQEKLLKKFGHFLRSPDLNDPNGPNPKDPEFWQVPDRNINFVGRSKILENLESKLDFESIKISTCKIVLIAMGGSGKSTIATEFLYRNKLKFSNIFWINSEVQSEILKQFQILGEKLKFERNEENEEKFAKKLIENWFEKSVNSNWILVLDNVEDQKTISNFIPRSGGFVLITSRNSNWLNFNEIKIERFEMEESIDLFKKILGSSDISEFGDISVFIEISKELCQLPLAITLASCYIKFHQILAAEYLKKFQDGTNEILKYKIDGVDKSVYISIKITLDKIVFENPLSYEWLQVCSFLQPDFIPVNFLENFLNFKNRRIDYPVNDFKNYPRGIPFNDLPENDPIIQREIDENMDKIREIILRYGLVKIDSEKRRFEMHRLVQKSIKIGLESEDNLLLACLEIIKSVNKYTLPLTPFIQLSIIAKLFQYAIDSAHKLVNQKSFDIQRFKRLNDIVNQYFAISRWEIKGMPDCFNSFENYFKNTGQILDSLDCNLSYEFHENLNVLHTLTLPKDRKIALKFLEKCFDISRKNYSPNDYVDCFQNLIECYSLWKNARKVEILYQHFIEISSKLCELNFAEILNSFGQAYFRIFYENSTNSKEKAIESLRKKFGIFKNHLELTNKMINGFIFIKPIKMIQVDVISEYYGSLPYENFKFPSQII